MTWEDNSPDDTLATCVRNLRRRAKFQPQNKSVTQPKDRGSHQINEAETNKTLSKRKKKWTCVDDPADTLVVGSV